ncbi:hypothetical protein KJ863_00450, partial [Patescibacteria group bacterium]|nr:hypothetical protein [Patescibacteria group bacterium]MBU4015659.1 hypothetical protein [Patescibacteria group bacterium]MBU4072577.1 hypothetical protein [Patescibacteria group bacterium]
AIGMVANNAVFIQAHGGTILELWGAGDSTEPTQKVTFKTNGNVGIGTAGPGRMLSLGEKAAQSAVLSFMDTDAVELGFVGVARATNDLVTGTTNTDLVIGGYAGSDIFLLDGTTINMVIKGNGNIGIGATNPGFKLQVTQPAADWTVHANGAGGYGLLATGSGYAGYFQGLIYGTSNLTVAGYATGQTGLCVGSDCRTSWPKLGSYSSRSWGTTYVAATDGFVAAHVYANSYQDSCDIDAKVWQGGAWNKVATAAAYHCGSAKCLVHHNSFTMPVSKGTSWLADKRNNYGSCEFTLQWIPLN